MRVLLMVISGKGSAGQSDAKQHNFGVHFNAQYFGEIIFLTLFYMHMGVLAAINFCT